MNCSPREKSRSYTKLVVLQAAQDNSRLLAHGLEVTESLVPGVGCVFYSCCNVASICAEEGRVLRSENKKNSITMSCVDGSKIFKMSHCSIAAIELRTVFQKLRRLPTFPNKERSVGPSSGYWSSRTLRIPTAPWLIFRE